MKSRSANVGMKRFDEDITKEGAHPRCVSNWIPWGAMMMTDSTRERKY